MSKGPNRRRYREGICPEFGMIRPVHLGDFVSFETRQVVSSSAVTLTTRLGWARGVAMPAVASYVSVHQPWGKFLATVDRVLSSCVCCGDRAMMMVFISAVPEAWPQEGLCECASKRDAVDSAHWAEPPERGLCRREGAGAWSLRDVSDAIKSRYGRPRIKP